MKGDSDIPWSVDKTRREQFDWSKYSQVSFVRRHSNSMTRIGNHILEHLSKRYSLLPLELDVCPDSARLVNPLNRRGNQIEQKCHLKESNLSLFPL
jgi:hypothetical protein